MGSIQKMPEASVWRGSEKAAQSGDKRFLIVGMALHHPILDLFIFLDFRILALCVSVIEQGFFLDPLAALPGRDADGGEGGGVGLPEDA